MHILNNCSGVVREHVDEIFGDTLSFDEKGELSGWRFTGGGYGHGVGLSQNGANGMAKQGKGYGEILHFFYTDVELTDIREM